MFIHTRLSVWFAKIYNTCELYWKNSACDVFSSQFVYNFIQTNCGCTHCSFCSVSASAAAADDDTCSRQLKMQCVQWTEWKCQIFQLNQFSVGFSLHFSLDLVRFSLFGLGLSNFAYHQMAKCTNCITRYDRQSINYKYHHESVHRWRIFATKL